MATMAMNDLTAVCLNRFIALGLERERAQLIRHKTHPYLHSFLILSLSLYLACCHFFLDCLHFRRYITKCNIIYAASSIVKLLFFFFVQI